MDIENVAELEVETSVSDVVEVETEKAGPPGLSAYEVAVKNGFVGTEEEWLASLQGEQGVRGETGPAGPSGQDGRDGAIQYTAGENITIDENNVISAAGGDLSNYYTKSETDSKFQTIMQFATMPTASADYTNKLIQYTGETNASFTNGHFYKCNILSYSVLDKAIANSGAYVGTGIIPTNHKIEISFNWPSYNNDNHIVGTSGTMQDPAWFIHFTTFNYKYYWGLNGQEKNGGTFTAGDHIVIFNDGADNKLLLDNVQMDTGLSASTTELTLFRRSGNANFIGSFYYMKIWDKSNNDTLIMDLVPILDSNNKVKFLNKVNNEILTPNGNLTAGTTTGETINMYWWSIADDYYTKTETDSKISNDISTALTSYLSKTNTTSYTPTSNYNPTTKLYVDLSTIILSGLTVHSSGRTYNIGDYVYRSATNPKIYRCKQNNIVGNFNTLYWDESTYLNYLTEKITGNLPG